MKVWAYRLYKGKLEEREMEAVTDGGYIRRVVDVDRDKRYQFQGFYVFHGWDKWIYFKKPSRIDAVEMLIEQAEESKKSAESALEKATSKLETLLGEREMI